MVVQKNSIACPSITVSVEPVMMSARESRIIKIIHTSEWINFVGPFEDEDAALAWLRNHFLEDAKVEIHKKEMPSIKNVAFPAGGDGGRKAA
jgi:hypothetical protein